MKGEFLIATKTGKYIQCEYCGKTVYKVLSQYNKREHHYCSNKCQGLHRRTMLYEDRACEICGSNMYVSKKSTQRFCSTKCQNIWQTSNTGFKNKRFRGGYVMCETCGKQVLVGQTIFEDDRHHFCSNACRRSWYSNTWSQSLEWREESKLRAVRILSEKPVYTQTKPQSIVNQLLDDLDIIYRNEESFVFYSIDNYLPEHNLSIEVMGDYWHSSPLKYTTNLNDKQKHIISRDKAKHTYIKNHFGIEILYLWEYDIINNPSLCRVLITEYISNNGVLANYHSFNYTIQDNTLSLIDNIIIPHQEQIAC